MVGVSSRTRSKNVPLFGSLSFHGSCSCSLKSKRRKSDMGLSSKKRKPNEEPFVLHEQVNVICIESDEEGFQESLKFCDKNFSEGCVDGDADEVGDEDWLEYRNKIKFEVGDEDWLEYRNKIKFEVGDEDWLEYRNNIKFEVDDIDVKNEEQSGDGVDNGGEGGLEDCENNSLEENEVESEKNGGIDDLVVKDESFDDDKRGLIPENLIIDSDDEDEGGLEGCEKNSFKGCVGVENEVESEKNGGIGELAEKDECFDDEKCGSISENPIIDSDDDDESDDDEDESEDEEDDGEDEESEESEEIETSDEEFHVDEVNEVSDSDNSSSSYAAADDNGEEKEVKKKVWKKEEEKKMGWEEEEEVVEEKEVDLEMVWQEYDNVLAEMVREAKGHNSNDELEHADDGNVRTSNALNKKGSFVPMEAPSSSKLHQASETPTSKGVQMKGRNVSDDDDNVYVGKTKSKAKESVIIGDFNEEKMQSVRGLGVGDVSDSSIQTQQKKMKGTDKQKMMEMKGRDYKGRANTSSSGEKKESMDKNGWNQRGKSTVFRPKELRLVELLAEYYWGNKNNKIQNDSPVLEMKDVLRHDTRPPPVSNETAPLIWSLKKVEKVQKTKKEEEEEVLWDQMDTTLRELEAESMVILLLNNI